MVANDANLHCEAVQALACLMRWQVPGELTPLRLVPAAADVAADVVAAPAKAQRAAFAALS